MCEGREFSVNNLRKKIPAHKWTHHLKKSIFWSEWKVAQTKTKYVNINEISPKTRLDKRWKSCSNVIGKIYLENELVPKQKPIWRKIGAIALLILPLFVLGTRVKARRDQRTNEYKKQRNRQTVCERERERREREVKGEPKIEGDKWKS